MGPLSAQVFDKICTNSSSSSITKPRRFHQVIPYENNLHLTSPIHYQSSTILTLIYAPTSIMHQGRGLSKNKRPYRWLVLDGFGSAVAECRGVPKRWQMPHGTSKTYAFFIAPPPVVWFVDSPADKTEIHCASYVPRRIFTGFLSNGILCGGTTAIGSVGVQLGDVERAPYQNGRLYVKINLQ